MRSIDRGGAERCHHHRRPDAHPACHLCDRDAVVAAAHRDDAGVALRRAEGEELVRHAARLEGARPLEQLELERRRDAEQPSHPGAGDRRRPFHVIRDRTGRRADLLDGHQVGHRPHAIRAVASRDYRSTEHELCGAALR
jgi:hypothetical protein